MRHQSLNLNKGALKSMGGQETAAQSGSLVAYGPEFNSSQAVLNSEVSKIQEYALQKHMFKNEQKLFRSQTGRGRVKAMSVLVNRGL